MEYKIGRIITLLGFALVGLCVYLIIDGQRSIGYGNVLEMLLGLSGILALLYTYNRKYR